MFVGKASVLALFCTTLVAALDELHQSTQLSRTGTPRDVLLDSAGAWFAQMLILVTASHWMRLITARAKNLEEHREPILRP
jgi:VanZ family protein